MADVTERLKGMLEALFRRAFAIGMFLLAWEMAVRSGLLYPTPVPPASSALLALKDLLATSEYPENTLASLQRIVLGYASATAVAVPLGVLVEWSNRVERCLLPLLRVLRQVPVIALFPVFILFWGLGEVPCVLILMFAALWSILLNTMNGVQGVEPSLVKAARSLGASQWDIIRKVILPSIVPSVFTGIRCAYTEILLVLIPVEMLGVNTGWGIGVTSHEHHGQNHILMYAILISMAVTGVAIDYILVSFERELCKWKEAIEGIPKPQVI